MHKYYIQMYICMYKCLIYVHCICYVHVLMHAYICTCVHVHVHVHIYYCTHSVEFAIHCWVSITEKWLRRRWFAAVVRMVVRINLIQIHFFPGLQQYVLYIITVERLGNEDVLYSFTCTVVHCTCIQTLRHPPIHKQHNTIQRHLRMTFQREISCLRWDSNPRHSAL